MCVCVCVCVCVAVLCVMQQIQHNIGKLQEASPYYNT